MASKLSLKGRTFIAVRWTALSSIVRGVVQLAQIAILARLLAHEDFGLMAIVWVILGITSILVDSGIGAAYLQRKIVTTEQRSSLFWLNVATGAFLSLLLGALSPFMASFFEDQRLAPLLLLSASILFINSLSLQIRWNAEKNLDFRMLSLIDIPTVVIGLVVAVSFAIYGYGVYSFVFGAIVTSILGAILTWWLISEGWRPLWRFRIEDVTSFLSFGVPLVISTIVSQLATGIDLLIGGRMLTAAQLGLYSVPRNLVIQIQTLLGLIVGRVGFPLIAQVQEDIPQVRSILLRTQNLVASICAPLFVSVSFYANDVVLIALGDGWDNSVDVLQVLAVWGLFRITAAPDASLTLGMGRSGLLLKWSLFMLLILPPTIWVGFYYYGTIGASWALLIFFSIMPLLRWATFVKPLCNVRLIDYLMSFMKPFLLAFFAVFSSYIVAIQFEGAIIHLLMGIIIAAPLYILISFKFNPKCTAEIMQLIGLKRLG